MQQDSKMEDIDEVEEPELVPDVTNMHSAGEGPPKKMHRPECSTGADMPAMMDRNADSLRSGLARGLAPPSKIVKPHCRSTSASIQGIQERLGKLETNETQHSGHGTTDSTEI